MPTPINDTIFQMFAGSRVFVIPTFQRPYGWSEPEWKDVVDDVNTAVARPDPFHYFAPIHVVPVANNPQIWQDYRDDRNEDLDALAGAGFRDQLGAVETLMVIDGQQRLITLLALMWAAIGASPASPLMLTLPNHRRIPKVILNPAEDHSYFLQLLATAPAQSPQPMSLSQTRLRDLVQFAGIGVAPRFPASGAEYQFLTGPDCRTLLIELPVGPRISSFMTLNDRGKDLSLFEKSKALFMGFDVDAPHPAPGPINDAFRGAYLSLNRTGACLDDDEFLRQFGWAVWGCLSVKELELFERGIESLYTECFRCPGQYFGNISNAAAVHANLLPRLRDVTDRHNELVDYLDQAQKGLPLQQPSFVCALLPGVVRDAIEDYHAILNGLRLNARQIGFLFQLRTTLGCHWHDPIGVVSIDNTSIIQALRQELLNIQGEIPKKTQGHDAAILQAAHIAVSDEANSVPIVDQRTVTPLHLAELLKIIINQTKPGGFANTWQWAFCQTNPALRNCASLWIDYITSYYARDRFVTGIMIRMDVHNNVDWLGYLAREYESWRSGSVDAQRQRDWAIEHVFPLDHVGFSLKAAGFNSSLLYTQGFVEQVGNRVILDAGLNNALGNLSPLQKLAAYHPPQVFGKAAAHPKRVSASAREFAADLSGVGTLGAVRLYVRLRAVRLAAFAARRF